MTFRITARRISTLLASVAVVAIIYLLFGSGAAHSVTITVVLALAWCLSLAWLVVSIFG